MDDQTGRAPDGQPPKRTEGQTTGRPDGKRKRAGKPATAEPRRVALTLKLPPDVIHRLKLHALEEGRTASELVAGLVETHCRTYSVSKRAGQGGGEGG